MAHFSDRIKSLRIERGITQEQLAAMLKVSRSTIGMYEAGKREPDFETSEAIADIFNVDMDYLTGRSDIQRMHPITPTTFIPTIYDRIKQRRLELGLTVEELAQKMGYKDKSSISKIENGKADIPQSKVVAFARALNTTTAFLIGVDAPAFSANSSVLPDTETDTLPRVGRIACGEPILAEQNIEDYDSVPSSWRATFTLICVGDSMAPRIQDGDLVAIRQQEEVENGEIAAVRIGDEATLKRVYFHDDYIELRPENPAYSSIIRRREEMDDVSIEGRAVGFCRGL